MSHLADSHQRTVRDLIARLSALDPDAVVVLSRDAEGNGFSCCLEANPYLFDQGKREIYLTPEQFAEEMADPASNYDAGDEPPEVGGDVKRAVVLWPV